MSIFTCTFNCGAKNSLVHLIFNISRIENINIALDMQIFGTAWRYCIVCRMILHSLFTYVLAAYWYFA